MHSNAIKIEVPNIHLEESILFNPLNPKGDQDQLSPNHINTLSSEEVMRIDEMKI